MGGIQCFLAWQPLHSSHCLDSDIYLSEIWSGHRAIETTEMRQRYWGRGEVFCVQSFIYFILLPSPDWLMDIMLQVDSTKCISIVESGATLYNDGSRWWYDEDVHINLFQVSVPAPSIHSCVSIASRHSARGEEGQEQQIFIKYLSRANFTILPSLLIYSRYLLICWDLFVCSFASISANVGDLLVSEDPHYPHHAPNTDTAWIEMFAFLCNCRYFRPILCRIDLIDIFLHNF